jgi:hypothetical protein
MRAILDQGAAHEYASRGPRAIAVAISLIARTAYIVAGLYAVLYSPNLAETGTGIARPLAIAGVLIVTAWIGKSRMSAIRVPIGAVGAVGYLLIALTFAQCLALAGGGDVSLKSFVVTAFTGVLPLTYIMVMAVPNDQPALLFLARCAAAIGALQAVFILGDWWSPAVREVFSGIVVQPESLDDGFRAAGLTSMTGDGLSVSQAICAICAAHLAVGTSSGRAMAGYLSALGLMLLAMVFVGRTGFVLIGAFGVLLLVFDQRRGRVLIGAGIAVALLLACTLLLSVSISDDRLAGLLSAAVSSAFEAVLGLAAGDGFRTASTDDLSAMIVFPDSIRGWLIGYGFYSNSVGSGGNFMGTDIGYLRMLFYVGLAGSMAIYAWYVGVGVWLFRVVPGGRDRLLCVGLISCFLLSQIKFNFLLLAAPLGFTALLFFAALRDRSRCT